MPSLDWNKEWGNRLFMWTKNNQGYYGGQWGDPENKEKLSFVIEKYISPYVNPYSVVLEIGPGGGRFTKYLLDAKKIILVDLCSEFFPYLSARFKDSTCKFQFYQTKGYELEGVDLGSVDFLFSFDAFVHIAPEGIYEYLKNIQRTLKDGGVSVIHYADKTKPKCRERKVFSEMTPFKMERFVRDFNFKIIEHNTDLMAHSSIIVLQKKW